MFLLKLERLINGFSRFLGVVAALLFILLLFNVFIDVIMRYLFNDVSIGMQELEWHLFATCFLLAIPYTLQAEGHVRVDLIYERLGINKRAVIDIIFTFLFLLPFVLLVGWYGIGFAWEAYELGETSGDPGGLPYRWIIKSMIPLSFFAIAISGVGLILKSVNTIRGYHQDEHRQSSSMMP